MATPLISSQLAVILPIEFRNSLRRALREEVRATKAIRNSVRTKPSESAIAFAEKATANLTDARQRALKLLADWQRTRAREGEVAFALTRWRDLAISIFEKLATS